MATTAIERLRRDVGANSTSLPDPAAQDLLDEAAETYTNATVASTYARVLAFQGLMASAAHQVSYRQNESSHSASDLFKHYEKELEKWEAKLVSAQKAAGAGAARFGRTTRRPARIYEYPGS